MSEKLYRRRFVQLMTAAAAVAIWPHSLALAAFHGRGPQRKVRLEDLDLSLMRQGWGDPHKNQSVVGTPLQIGAVKFAHGIGTHAPSAWNIDLQKAAVRFTAWVGVDHQKQGPGAVIFEVLVDGKVALRTPVLRQGQAPYKIDLNLRGAKSMLLLVHPGRAGIDFDHADWADPVITMSRASTAVPAAVGLDAGSKPPELVGGDPPTPEFHGPRVIGTTPGRPFLFQVPHTGTRPITIKATGLPDGLTMTPGGLITGTVHAKGQYHVKLTARNGLGHATRTLRIVAGEHQLALTPPMGWNSWNAYGMNNSAAKTRAAAEAMVKTGLAAKGFMYINIDDGWQNGRTPSGEIKTTPAFGDMKELADYVHARGLRFGLYSSPGPTTCGGHTGSYQHEPQDARTYAAWGVDYLKYDWCSYGRIAGPHPDLEQLIRPYATMRTALDNVPRDIFLSLCQYGMGHVWTWGGRPPVFGNSYRISGDINDSWGAVCRNGFAADGRLFPFAGPGHWNDPDMLVVGYGYFEDGPLHWTKLTPWEQVTHVTLWCMLAAPLLLGCDLEKLNRFTLNLMTNTEVLAVNQDELGQQAQRVARKGQMEVWARPLWDGTVAVAVFNRGFVPATTTLTWAEIAPVIPSGKMLVGRQPVRDLWRRQDLGVQDHFAATVAPHGALMLKVGTPDQMD